MKNIFNTSKLVALFLVLFSFGCETSQTGNWENLGDQPTRGKDLTINVAEKGASNGDMAQFMIRLLELENAVADKTDKKLCIAELQQMGHWPKGIYNINAPLTNITMLKIEHLKRRSGRQVLSKEAQFAHGSEIKIKIYDIGQEREEREEIETKVDKNGNITLPYIKRVSVVGLTAAEASTKIRQSYIDKGIYKDLTVDVTSKAGFLYVEGEIKEPGKKDFLGGMTLSDLLIESGGMNEFAKFWEIKIKRGSQQSIHNYEEIREGKAKDPILKPGDRVFIPRRVI